MIVWSPDPVAIHLLGIDLRWYPAFILVGFFLGKIYVTKFLKREMGLEEYDSIILLNYLILGALVGGRLGHCLFYDLDYYLKFPLEIVMFWRGGLASHGGYLGILFTMWLFSHKYKQMSYIWLLDVVAPSAILTGGFIRLGNLFNSEIIGKSTDVAWSFIFYKVDTVPRHPVQAYEALGYFVIAFFGFYLLRTNMKDRKEGLIFGMVLVSSLAVRYASEFYKVEQEFKSQTGSTAEGKVFSVLFVLLGLILILRRKKSHV